MWGRQVLIQIVIASVCAPHGWDALLAPFADEVHQLLLQLSGLAAAAMLWLKVGDGRVPAGSRDNMSLAPPAFQLHVPNHSRS